MEVDWKRAVDFAEYAEALGIRTTQIMALKAGGGDPSIVIYTPETDEGDLDPETPLLASRLQRDHDGILVAMGAPTIMEGFNWNALEASIEARLRELEQ
jgi:hypothetical protein